MAIYMDYNGIKGDVEESGHKNWVELSSFKWGFGRNVSLQVGSGADREPSLPGFDAITIAKPNDVASGKLMQEALTGKGVVAKIHWTRTSSNSAAVYLKLVLNNAIISSYDQGGTDRPEETLQISYTAFDFETQEMTDSGTEGQPGHVVYNLAEAK